MRALSAVAIGCLLALGGCGAAPAWLTIAGPALSYVASVNQAGVETLRFVESERAPGALPCAWQGQILPLPETLTKVIEP